MGTGLTTVQRRGTKKTSRGPSGDMRSGGAAHPAWIFWQSSLASFTALTATSSSLSYSEEAFATQGERQHVGSAQKAAHTRRDMHVYDA